MEKNMRELGVKSHCISLKPKSRPICGGNISRTSTRFSNCQEAGRKKLHYIPTCSKNDVYEEDTCGCSVAKQKTAKSACNECLDESEDDNENYQNIEWRSDSQEKLKNQYKSSRSTSESEYNRYQTQRKKKRKIKIGFLQQDSRRECANKHRRNTLRTQLSHLLKKIKPTPENCVLDNTETKPEPEILAEVLLMSELEGADLSSLSPGNIFNKVFADSRDLPSYSSNLPYNSMDKKSLQKNPAILSLIESNGEENIETPTDDTLSYINEEYDDSTQYKSLPLSNNKFPRNSSPLGHSTPLDISSVDLHLKNHWLPEDSPCTKVQINGTIKPIWFPGYVVISSVQQNYIRITSNPEAALYEIWRLCRPQNISPASKLILK